ncbi:2-succinyl-6-hydroxy-2,4-cyclohexadiene-1- carboxylic acid synthase/2-oxoglutarate decarboxylase [Janibacter hoylei PVAS-1]|uniref:2-succinyl-6-hydroxy-2,4-cyclohexadiene-1-carboxylic acid synthase/2-oxoglutarate decarboxylase n=1 Tax=Janibacter hoylei PVAS-1 TaxID=1210046 RepID=K1E979_9MICO|nr:2-succinyl-6-hydroxy-2,4-cyclohexadiene-1- carboxylic acid synthase/2-oxoglutarate decarboxylase [Janibacter hoylei PVAS-1]
MLDDDGGSIFTTLEYGAPELAGSLSRLFTTPTGTDIGLLCAAHGVPATTAWTTDELAGLLRQPSPGIRVIRVPVSGSGRRAAGQRVRAAVAAALG